MCCIPREWDNKVRNVTWWFWIPLWGCDKTGRRRWEVVNTVRKNIFHINVSIYVTKLTVQNLLWDNCFNNIITLSCNRPSNACTGTIPDPNYCSSYTIPDSLLIVITLNFAFLEISYCTSYSIYCNSISKYHENCTRHAPKCWYQLKVCRSNVHVN